MRLSPPRILVHEYVTGGGWQEEEWHDGLAAEGLAILQAILSDFRSWGRAYLITTCDSRLGSLPVTADRIVDLHHENHLQVLNDLIREADAALIIAPESGGILARLSALVEAAGTRLLGSSSTGVAIAADKWQCFGRFIQQGLPTPETHRAHASEADAAAAALGFPLVVKPVDGVGCDAVSLVSDTLSLRRALQLMEPGHRDVLLQRYVAGIHASVSLLLANRGVLPLSLNEQIISVGLPFHYLGGSVPLEHGLKTAALETATRATSLIPGLKGYVGVDVVIAEGQCQLIEINPRLTTSYVGLRQVININLAEAIWHACSTDTLPLKITLSEKSSFRKEVFDGIQNA